MSWSVSERSSTGRGRRIGRRGLLKGLGAGAACAAIPSTFFVRTARSAESIVVAQPGGPYEVAYRVAFAEPFTAKTGIEVNLVARPFFPSGQVQTQVETKNYTWDIVSLSSFDVEILTARDMLEELEWSGPDMAEIMESARRPNWMGTDTYATILSYRTDKFGEDGPANWADFWNVDKFPGRRAMYKNPIGTLEEALMADGVAQKDLYPIDYERAFASLDRIKPHVDVWWTSGAQSTQLLHDGNVDLTGTWNGRAQAAIDAGAPVRIQWNQGLYTVHGLAIPKGAPKADVCREFIEFCANAERQAAYTPHMASGPTNLNAYQHIDKELQQTLPTAPANIGELVEQSTTWWTEHKEEAIDRFNEWLLA